MILVTQPVSKVNAGAVSSGGWLYSEPHLRTSQKIHAVGGKDKHCILLAVHDKSEAQHQLPGSQSRITQGTAEKSSGHRQPRPWGETDALKAHSIHKGCPWRGTFLGDPDSDLGAERYVPLPLR